MRVEDIRHMMNGKPFKVFEIGKQPRCFKAVDMNIVNTYIHAHSMTRLFGLPNGQGWANESPLTLKILAHFQNLTVMIENWNTRKGTRNG